MARNRRISESHRPERNAYTNTAERDLPSIPSIPGNTKRADDSMSG